MPGPTLAWLGCCEPPESNSTRSSSGSSPPPPLEVTRQEVAEVSWGTAKTRRTPRRKEESLSLLPWRPLRLGGLSLSDERATGLKSGIRFNIRPFCRSQNPIVSLDWPRYTFGFSPRLTFGFPAQGPGAARRQT